mgnify:CR=1 FL=1
MVSVATFIFLFATKSLRKITVLLTGTELMARISSLAFSVHLIVEANHALPKAVGFFCTSGSVGLP